MYYYLCVDKIYKVTTLSPTIMEVENMTILEDLVSSFRALSWTSLNHGYWKSLRVHPQIHINNTKHAFIAKKKLPYLAFISNFHGT